MGIGRLGVQVVRDLIEEGSQQARQRLLEQEEAVERLAKGLLEYETLSGEEIKDLLEKGVAPNRDESNFPNAGPSVSVPVTPVSDGTEVEPSQAGAPASSEEGAARALRRRPSQSRSRAPMRAIGASTSR